MISWIGFIGDLTSFIMEKVKDKKPEISLEQKKQIGRKFYDYYESIERLEMLTIEFFKFISPVVDGKKSRLYSNWTNGLDRKFQIESENFRNRFNEIRPILSYYEPNLHLMFSRFQSLKEIRLSYLSLKKTEALNKMRFEFNMENSTLKSLEYTIPSDELIGVDFQKIFDKFGVIEIDRLENLRYMANIIKENDFLNNFEKPYDAISGLIEGKYEPEIVNPSEVEKIKQLNDLLKKKLKIYSISRQALREFITNNFSLGDLLYFEEND